MQQSNGIPILHLKSRLTFSKPLLLFHFRRKDYTGLYNHSGYYCAKRHYNVISGVRTLLEYVITAVVTVRSVATIVTIPLHSKI